MILRRFALVAPLLLCLSACLSSGLPDLRGVPPFQLTAQDGKPFVSTPELSGKVWVGDFIFTTCHGPCPRMTAQMKKIQDQVKDLTDVELVSFTVDPATDTPEILAEYANRFHADPDHWHFLTGTQAALQKLSYDTFRLGDTGAKLEHSTRFVLIDRKSRIRGYYDTTDPSAIQQVVDDIAKLRKEVL